MADGRRRARLWAVAGAAAVVAGLALPGAGHADTIEANSLVLSHSFKGSSDRYNYAPTAVQVGTVRHYYWCGYDKAYGNFDSDTILTQSIDTKTGHRTPVEVALRPTRGAWDKQYTCNPGVVMGSFTNPTDHRHYRIALFYVGAANAKGVHNSIGVAYSNDWTTFHKRSTPVLSPPAGCASRYGYGQPSVYNHDGRDELWMFYDDTCAGVYKRVELDGANRGATSTVTTKGFAHSEGLEFGYDDTAHAWYAAGNSEADKRAHERGAASFQLYRISEGGLTSGSVTGSSSWSEVSRVDTNLVGYESFSIPTVLRDPYGNVTIPGVYPDIVLPYTVTNTHRPAARSTLTADNTLTSAPNWRVTQITWRPGHPLRPLKRYYSAGLHRDEVTTGYVDTHAFTYETTLGDLFEEPDGAATRALYGCRNGSDDYFVSTHADCEGKKLLGLEGYAYPSQTGQSVPLYRCNTGGAHFVSADAGCEGHIRESLLGWAQDGAVHKVVPGATGAPKPSPSAGASAPAGATAQATPAGEPGYPVKGHRVTVKFDGVHIRTWPGGATSRGTTKVGDGFFETRKTTDGAWIYGTDTRTDVSGWIPTKDAML